MLRASIALVLTIGSTLAFGCNIESGDEVGLSTSAIITEAGLVEFLGDYNVSTLPVLDFTCALRSDSARNIDNYRQGADLIYGTADDRTIDSEAELDSIYMVGPWTITQLYTCAEGFGYEGTSCDPNDVWTEEGDVPGGLDGEVDQYEGLNDLCGDGATWVGVSHFGSITTTYSDCGVVSYEMTWWQSIAEEGVQEILTNEYDAELNLVDSYCEAG